MRAHRSVATAAAVVGLAVLGVGVVADPSTAAGPNLIEDGSFELPATPPGGVTSYPSGDGFGPWLVIGGEGDVATLSSTFTSSGYGFKAQSGKASLDLTGYASDDTGISQPVATTPGKKYTLTFYVGNNGSNAGVTTDVETSVNGQLREFDNAAHGKKDSWKKFTEKFTAQGTTTTINFYNNDAPGGTYAGLDNVVLTAG